MRIMPVTREYGTLERHELSRRTVLESFEGWTLTHHGEGYEPAGSAARYTRERWSVLRHEPQSNTTHGRSYLTREAAEAYFVERVALARRSHGVNSQTERSR